MHKGQAGKFQSSEGESALAMRRRLNAAAKLTGKDLVIKRAGEEVYFWEESKKSGGRRRRGRPRKQPASEV